MISSFTAAQTRQAEAELFRSVPEGRVMELAARGAATVILRELKARRGRVSGARVLLLVGKGNNGGDALYAGSWLARRGVAVTAVASGTRVHEAAGHAFLEAGGRLWCLSEGGPGQLTPIEDVAAFSRHCDGIVDALVGIGARGPLSGHAAGLVTTLTVDAGIGAPYRYRDASRPVVFAMDVPSGVGVDDGMVDGPVLPADVTIAVGAYKPALLLPPAALNAGKIVVVDIALPFHGLTPAVRSLQACDALGLWPIPRRADHKYTRGVLGVVAGSDTYPGAAVLCTSAAVRAGVGMVRYLGPDSATERVLSKRPEVVPGGGRVDAWAVGPGVAPGADDQLERIRRAVDWSRSERVPAVIDAGGFAELGDARLEPWMVLTPHAGELARLLQDRGVPVERGEIEFQPVRYARMAADLTGATILLKGAVTVVAGQTDGVYVQADGTPWLATAGTGDVLTGVLGALLAGHGPSVAISPELPAQLAALAAMVHGMAATAASGYGQGRERASDRIGNPIAALDVVEHLPGTIGRLLERR